MATDVQTAMRRLDEAVDYYVDVVVQTRIRRAGVVNTATCKTVSPSGEYK